jgi:hypothetical protein
MKVLKSFNDALKKIIYKHIVLFVVFFSILSLTSVSSLWWLSLFSIVFFTWNFFNRRKYLGACITFLSIAVSLIIFHFAVIVPVQKWGDKALAEWERTGYDAKLLPGAQESINVIARSVEEYKKKYDKYPDEISDIRDIFINNEDLSYRVKNSNGQIRGIAFYYEKVDSSKFFLAGVGKDGIIKTKDDLFPQISLEQEKTTGLLKYVVKSFSNEEIKREKEVIRMYKQAKDWEKQEEEK